MTRTEAALDEFLRRYRAQGGTSDDPLAAVEELFAAFEQAKVFAREIHSSFAGERERVRELAVALADLRHTHEELSRSEQRFRSLVTHSSDATLIVDPDGTVNYVSPSARRVLSTEPARLLGRSLDAFVHPDDIASLRRAMLRANNTASPVGNVGFRMTPPGGGVRHIEAAVTSMADDGIEGTVLNTRDVTEHKRLERELTRQAFHDPLTGLPNRALLMTRLAEAFEAADRAGGPSLLLLDLDRFKLVNDTRGYGVGDELLAYVAERLRETVDPGSTVARLSGDEFAVLLPTAAELAAREVGAAIVRELNDRRAGADHGRDLLGASVGIACAEPGVHDATGLLRAADLALYEAKRTGGGRAAFFDPANDSVWADRIQLEADLRGAARRGELRLDYQPLIRIGGDEIIAVEALVRWQHPERGLTPPDAFIPIAEESGEIVVIGAWVLNEACAQLSRWLAETPEAALYLSVNVSVVELRDPGYVARVRSAIERTGIPPERLQLEITESVLVDDPPLMLQRMHALKELGVRLAIDDFGTGYSSLSYIARMPIDMMKVDRSFVTGMHDERVETTLRAMVTLAQALDLSSVAEGVETQAQLAHLQEIGCVLAQGHLYSRPVTPEDIAVRLRSEVPGSSAMMGDDAPSSSASAA